MTTELSRTPPPRTPVAEARPIAADHAPGLHGAEAARRSKFRAELERGVRGPLERHLRLPGLGRPKAGASVSDGVLAPCGDRVAARSRPPGPAGDRDGDARSGEEEAGSDGSPLELPAGAEPALEPFRIGPSVLMAPAARALALPPPLEPAAVGAELLESLRLGRVGAAGHALTMRVRGARGSLDVELREDDEALSLRIRGEDDAECERLLSRVRDDLRARGIEVEAG